jgi:hypothetical protein
MSTLKIFAWGLVAAIVLVIVFIRAPLVSGDSGGKQASDIINSSTQGFAAIIKAATGG